MLDQIYRVLAPKGIYICVTYGTKDIRYPYLQKVPFLKIKKKKKKKKILNFFLNFFFFFYKKEEYEWNIIPYQIYKPRVDTAASQFDESDENDFHYVYVCKKGVNRFFSKISLFTLI